MDNARIAVYRGVMPSALPQPFRAFRRAAEAFPPVAPARFLVPTVVDRRFCSTDDREELRRIRRERRDAMTWTRRTDERFWRDAP